MKRFAIRNPGFPFRIPASGSVYAQPPSLRRKRGKEDAFFPESLSLRRGRHEFFRSFRVAPGIRFQVLKAKLNLSASRRGADGPARTKCRSCGKFNRLPAKNAVLLTWT